MVDYNGLDIWQRDRKVGQPSLFERVQSFLTQFNPQVQEQGLVAGLDQTKFAIVPDFSHWNGEIDLTKMTGIAGIWTKACDGKQMYAGGNGLDKQLYIDKTLRPNIQKAYDLKIPCGIYIYFQPLITDYTHRSIVDWHFDVFKEAVKGLIPGKSYHAIGIDVEEKGDTDVNVRDKVLGLYNRIKADPAFGHLPIYIYTSMSILNGYPAFRDAISYKDASYNLWLAQWAYGGTKSNWEAMRNTIIPALNMRVITPGFNTWKFLQWAVFSGMPGCPGGCDINFYKGTREDFHKEWNYTSVVTPPVDPPDEPPTTDPALAARVTALEADNASLKARIDAMLARMDKHLKD